MQKLRFTATILVVSLIFTSCSTSNGNSTTKEVSESITPQQELTALFEKNQYEVTLKEDTSKLFSGKTLNFSINDEVIRVAVYDTETQAKEILSNISKDGFQFTRTGPNKGNTSISIDWTDQPHFYQYKNFLIYYIGKDNDTMQALTELFGAPAIG